MPGDEQNVLPTRLQSFPAENDIVKSCHPFSYHIVQLCRSCGLFSLLSQLGGADILINRQATITFKYFDRKVRSYILHMRVL